MGDINIKKTEAAEIFGLYLQEKDLNLNLNKRETKVSYCDDEEDQLVV